LFVCFAFAFDINEISVYLCKKVLYNFPAFHSDGVSYLLGYNAMYLVSFYMPHAGFLLRFLFDPKNGGDMVIQIVG
jgi:hypothetical protein